MIDRRVLDLDPPKTQPTVPGSRQRSLTACGDATANGQYGDDVMSSDVHSRCNEVQKRGVRGGRPLISIDGWSESHGRHRKVPSSEVSRRFGVVL
jgi:hypothetical protein